VICLTSVFADHGYTVAMHEQPSWIPNWLTIDFVLIVAGAIVIAIGIWIGFAGPPFP
jgi:hypothetical protein